MITRSPTRAQGTIAAAVTGEAELGETGSDSNMGPKVRSIDTMEMVVFPTSIVRASTFGSVDWLVMPGFSETTHTA